VTFLTIANSVNKMLSVLHGRKANSVKSPPDHQSVYKIVHSVTWIVKIEDWQLFRKSSTVPTGEITLSVFLVFEETECASMYFVLIFSFWDLKSKYGSYYG
jgi:hypothetical protein